MPTAYPMCVWQRVRRTSASPMPVSACDPGNLKFGAAEICLDPLTGA